MIPRLTKEPGAIETATQIASGALTPTAATEAAIARIEALDGAINAVVVRDFERARAAARALEQAGPQSGQPLFGVPMTVKESFDVAGLPSSWGMAEHREAVAKRDAVVVERLKRAGAVILGKTNVPPMLADWQATNPNYGRTVNPHDAERTPGGSSGGSAAALATGMVPAEYGSDIGGSIRIPAHFSGVWGHKTTWGVVSSRGQDFPGSDGRDVELGVVGPLARSGEDLALLFEVTVDRPLPRADKPVGEWRVLHLADHPVAPAGEAVKAPIEAAVRAVEAAGARVDRASDRLPDLARQYATYLPMLQIAMSRGAPGPEGQVATAAQWFDLLDAQAREQRAWTELFADYDFGLAPPAALPAFPHDAREMRDRVWSVDDADLGPEAVLAYAGLATFPGLPSTVLPVGSAGHLPVGMQVIGDRFRDHDTIAAATAIGALFA
jgi:amidase